MSRVIKFRAWYRPDKTMHTEVEHYTYSDGSQGVTLLNIPHTGRHFAPDSLDVELMQFTGLLDKNNKEIYEGDICYLESSYLKKYRVYWCHDRWGLEAANGEDYDNGDYYRGDDINNWSEWEVIGNIYENKDLLNEMKSE